MRLVLSILVVMMVMRSRVPLFAAPPPPTLPPTGIDLAHLVCAQLCSQLSFGDMFHVVFFSVTYR